MRSQRELEAAEFRAQGKEQAQQIRARAEKEREFIISDANKQGKTLQGEGDKISLITVGKATNLDPEFYAFFKSLEAYKNGFDDDETTFFLSPNNDFMKYFKSKK